MVAGTAGVWLFYVQHQFEGVYWERGEEWDYARRRLQGSSFYKLPEGPAVVLGQHRLSPHPPPQPAHPQLQSRKCHQADPLFQTRQAGDAVLQLQSFTFRLWDEQRRKLVGYGHLRQIRREQRQAAASRQVTGV